MSRGPAWGPAADLDTRVAANPDADIVRMGTKRWSTVELAAGVQAAAEVLTERIGAGAAAERRSRVAICVPDPADQLVWALAGCRVGAAVAVLDVGWPAAQRASARSQLEPVLVVGDPPPVPGSPGSAGSPGAAGDPPDWISMTSGTSGAPRAIRRTAASWAGSFPAFSGLTGVQAHDTVLVPGRLSSSMVAFAALHTVATGACLRLMPGWAPAADGVGDVTVAHLVPTMLADLLDSDSPIRPRVVVCAGAKLPAELERRALAAWPGVRLVEYYGSSEQSFVTARVGGDPDSVGRAFPGVRVEIRDPAGRRVPTGEPGEIWTSSPYLADGYVDGQPGRFQCAAGWASVGDHGRLDATGVLTLLGRENITTGGATVDPAAVEAVLRRLPGVRDAVVFGVPHRRLGEIVAAVVEIPTGLDAAALRRYAREQLVPAQRPRRWYAVARLPRTAGGKPARAELLDAARGGRLRALS